MKVSLVVPVKNEEVLIQDCIDMILQQEYLPSEVLIVDNGSTDRTYDIIKENDTRFQKLGVHLIPLRCEHGNQLEARILGFNHAKYDLIVSIDADTVLPPRWIATAVQLFESNAKLVGAGGPMIYDKLWITIPNYLLFLFYHIFPSRYFFYGPNAVFRRVAYQESQGLQHCRKFIDAYHFSEPYDDLYLSYTLKQIGVVKGFFQLQAFGTFRVHGSVRGMFSVLYRGIRQYSDSHRVRRYVQKEIWPIGKR